VGIHRPSAHTHKETFSTLRRGGWRRLGLGQHRSGGLGRQGLQADYERIISAERGTEGGEAPTLYSFHWLRDMGRAWMVHTVVASG
jgi:hypothetical protein